MKKTLLTLIFLICCLIISYSQSLHDQNRFSSDLNGTQSFIGNGVTTTVIEVGRKDPNIKGTPYVIDKFIPAKISITPNQIYSVKYNGLLDEFEVLGKDNAIYAINKNESKDVIISILNTKKKYQAFNYFSENNELELGYFILINSQNPIKLLKKEQIIFISEKISSTGFDKAQKAEYKRSKDKYYIKVKDLEAVLLPSNKKKLVKLFPTLEKNILAFIKTQKIKLNKEIDLMKLINYLNQISL